MHLLAQRERHDGGGQRLEQRVVEQHVQRPAHLVRVRARARARVRVVSGLAEQQYGGGLTSSSELGSKTIASTSAAARTASDTKTAPVATPQRSMRCVRLEPQPQQQQQLLLLLLLEPQHQDASVEDAPCCTRCPRCRHHEPCRGATAPGTAAVSASSPLRRSPAAASSASLPPSSLPPPPRASSPHRRAMRAAAATRASASLRVVVVVSAAAACRRRCAASPPPASSSASSRAASVSRLVSRRSSSGRDREIASQIWMLVVPKKAKHVSSSRAAVVS